MDSDPAYLLYYERLLRLDRRGAIEVVNAYLDEHGDIQGVYSEILVPALIHTGREWETDRITVAHEHYISEVTRDVIRQLGPRTWNDEPGLGPVAVACCVPGERHGIGLMMITDALRAAGMVVHGLGEDVPTDSAVEFVREVGANLLCLSCALDIHLPEAAELIGRARAAQPGLRVLVGGRAFDGQAQAALGIGADMFAADLRGLQDLIPDLVARPGGRAR